MFRNDNQERWQPEKQEFSGTVKGVKRTTGPVPQFKPSRKVKVEIKDTYSSYDQDVRRHINDEFPSGRKSVRGTDSGSGSHKRSNRTGTKIWSEKELDLLRTLKAQGTSYEEMSEKIGRSPDACRVMSRTIGLESRIKLWTIEEVGRAQKMKADGMTYRQIGNELGRTRDAVEAIFSKIRHGKYIKYF